MNQRTLTGIIAFIALIAGIVGAIFIAPPKSQKTSPSTQYFKYYPAPRELPEFTLNAANGDTLTKKNLQNQWTLVFVGYTYCPDICPTTMSNLARIWPILSSNLGKANIKVLFVSIDPKRDTVQRLNDYVGFFNDEFWAATGEHSQLFPLVKSMGLMYAITESTEKPDYLVDHSASVVVINPDAKAIGRFKPILEPGELAVSDSEQILADMPGIVNSQ